MEEDRNEKVETSGKWRQEKKPKLRTASWSQTAPGFTAREADGDVKGGCRSLVLEHGFLASKTKPGHSGKGGKVKVKVGQSCPVLCDPMDFVHGILQARLLEWVAFPFSRGSSQTRDRTQVSHRWILYQLSHQGSPFIAWFRTTRHCEGNI